MKSNFKTNSSRKPKNKKNKSLTISKPVIHTTVLSKEPVKYKNIISIDDFIFQLKKITKQQAGEQKELGGFSVSELAEKLNVSNYTICKLLRKANGLGVLKTSFVLRPRIDGLLARTPIYFIVDKNKNLE